MVAEMAGAVVVKDVEMAEVMVAVEVAMANIHIAPTVQVFSATEVHKNGDRWPGPACPVYSSYPYYLLSTINSTRMATMTTQRSITNIISVFYLDTPPIQMRYSFTALSPIGLTLSQTTS